MYCEGSCGAKVDSVVCINFCVTLGLTEEGSEDVDAPTGALVG